MSDAVAKLRFDLLANVAGMTAPLGEAGAASEKMAQRFNRAFDSTKAAAARAEKELESWQSAIAGIRTEFAKGGESDKYMSMFDLGGKLKDVALRNEVRIKDSLPFGKTTRTAISKEAAETAALLGKETNSLKAKLDQAAQGLVRDSGLSGALKLATNPAVMAGAAAFGAYQFISGSSEEMRNRARAATHASQVMGTDVESASRLNAVGFEEEAGARFQRSLSEGSKGFGMIGLDASKLATEPLTQALAQVGTALKNTASPADRAAAAMEIFGRSGSELIPILTGLKGKLDDVAESAVVTAQMAEKAKIYDAAKRESQHAISDSADRVARGLGSSEDAGTTLQEYAGAFATFLTRGDTAKYWEKSQNAKDRASKAAMMEPILAAQAKQAENAARQKQIQDDAQKSIDEMHEHSQAGLISARGRDRWGNQNEDIVAGVHKQGLALGWGDNRMGAEIAQQEAYRRSGQLAQQAWGLASHRTAGEQYEEEQRAIDEWREHVAPGRTDANLQLSRMEKQSGKNYEMALGIKDPMAEYQERIADLIEARKNGVDQDKLHRAAVAAADSLTAAMDTPFMTAFERYEAHMKLIGRQTDLLPDERKRREQAETEGILAHAGIRRPEEEFRKSFEEISQLRDRDTITQKEFDRRKKELEEGAAGEMTRDVKHVSPVAAMAAGSQQLASLLSRAQVGSEKDRKQDEANRILKKIEENVRPGNRPQGKTLDG